jgi:hypothetical protein
MNEVRKLIEVLGHMTQQFLLDELANFIRDTDRYATELRYQVSRRAPSFRQFSESVVKIFGEAGVTGMNLALGFIFHSGDADPPNKAWLDLRLPLLTDDFVRGVIATLAAEPMALVKSGEGYAESSPLICGVIDHLRDTRSAELVNGLLATFGLFRRLDGLPAGSPTGGLAP